MKPLSSYPILHHFIALFVKRYMSDENYESIFDELCAYCLTSICGCKECGTVTLEAPAKKNLFSAYEAKRDGAYLIVNLGEIILISKTLSNPKLIEFEAVSGRWSQNSVPYWSELTTSMRIHPKEAKRNVQAFFEANPEMPIKTVVVD